MSDAAPTITQLALDLHTDLANIKNYFGKSPAVTLAIITEAETKLLAISRYIGEVRLSVVPEVSPATPVGWTMIEGDNAA